MLKVSNRNIRTRFKICDALRDFGSSAYKRRANGWPKPFSNQLECVRMFQSGKRFSPSVCLAFKLLFDIQPFAWNVHDVRMTYERISRKHSSCIICCKNRYISLSLLKADDEIKVRRTIFTLKTLTCVQHIMRVLGFLLILLVLILFIVSNRFFCYFKLMKFTMRKNRLKTVYASDSIQQERFPVSLKVGRIYF